MTTARDALWSITKIDSRDAMSDSFFWSFNFRPKRLSYFSMTSRRARNVHRDRSHPSGDSTDLSTEQSGIACRALGLPGRNRFQFLQVCRFEPGSVNNDGTRQLARVPIESSRQL